MRSKNKCNLTWGQVDILQSFFGYPLLSFRTFFRFDIVIYIKKYILLYKQTYISE